ncbi:hypothetical protein ABMA27_003315 [Loxostege sticticalis]|uniref:FP protein C-terminal domain-containing protein n=1 Tax=Loxostege sticticalis TaxID=481309 RepID=A0ABR3HQF1_LOXSC
MESELNRTKSDSHIYTTPGRDTITPPNYVAFRSKRCREDLEDERFEKLKEDMMSALQTMMQNEFKKINPLLQDIKKTNQSIEESMSFLAAQNEELKKRLDRLECESKKDKEYIMLLEDKLEDVKRENQKGHFEIKNVPQIKPTETKDDLVKIVLCLSQTIDCSLTEKDITDVYRIRAKREPTKNTPIIVETSSAILKSTVLQKCKAHNIKNKEKLRAKHLGFKTNEDTPIYVSEQLTSKGARLYFLARDLAKTKSYTFCWTSFGRVYVRKTTDSPVILIRNEAQVHNLMQQT